jgi:hypothetical protein
MDITAEIIASFRLAYPVFKVAATWPDPVLTMALCEGDAESGGKRWGSYEDDCHNLKQKGMFLYAAHWLKTTYPNVATDDTAQSGNANNTVTSKSVGDESVSFGAATLTDISQAGDGWLASTSWGQQFMRLRKRVGMGALAV